MELRHLRYFQMVAEELNFSRAAERLHIAQPPLSQQIHNLETELGVILFERNKRRVKLTAAGQVFLAATRRILQEVDRAVRSTQQVARGELGQLIIGFNSSASYSVLPPILSNFRQICPDIQLVLHELTTSQQRESLNNQDIDVGLLYYPLEDENLNFIIVHKDPLIVALPESHFCGDRASVSLQILKNESFILPPHQLGEGLYKKIMSLFEQVNFVPKIEQEAVQLQTILSLVAGGIGVAIVPASLQNLKREGVIYKPLSETTPELEIAVAWRRNDTSPILCEIYIDRYNHCD